MLLVIFKRVLFSYAMAARDFAKPRVLRAMECEYIYQQNHDAIVVTLHTHLIGERTIDQSPH